VDIQDIYRIDEKVPRAGMADLAAELIDPKLIDMKKAFKTGLQTREGHQYWAWKPLAEKNLKYAAIDGYISYEIYRRIMLVVQGQRHLKANATEVICPKCKEADRSWSSSKRKTGWE
jgi:ribonuclease D